MKTHREVTISAIYDPAARVFVATSNDVPGLVTEAPSMDVLQRELEILIPELLRANNLGSEARIPFRIMLEGLVTA
jgi:hypothetical protein